MEHPAGKYKKPLLAIRIVQVIITLINAILSVLLVAAASSAAHQVRRDPTYAEARENPAVNAAIGAVIGVVVFNLVLAVTCVITCSLWLYYTAKPSARLRSCGGHKPTCMRYSCDMGWDIFWAVLWGINFAVSLVSRSNSVAMKIGNVITSLMMLCLFGSTAVLSGKVRSNLLAAVAAAPKDIEAQIWASAHPVPPIVMGAPTPTHRV